MRRRVSLLALAAMALLPTAPAPAVTTEEAAALGREAYLYGFPLLETLRVRSTGTSVRCPDAQGHAPVNALSVTREFARPQDRDVVAPNVDTLYTIAFLDLGRGPVVLRHPAMGDRYFDFQFLDPYTNTVGYIGTRTTGSKAGRFVLTRKRFGARRLWMIGRTLITDRPDQRRALKLMDRYRLIPPGGERRFPGCRPGQAVEATTPEGLAFLDALGTATRQNPPPPRDRPLLERLATVGVGPGLKPQKAGLPAEVLDALVRGVTDTAAALPATARATVLGGAVADGGWAIPAANIGDYGTDYEYRAGVALLGLGANTPEEAMYPTALLDADGQPLNGEHRYRITFPEEPPARAFWSLTMYDLAGHLVANPLDRYAIGSSHPPLARGADGSVVVVIQPEKPTEAGVNWLPPPAGPFRLNLRLYTPTAAALGGDWMPPPVRRVE